MAGVWMLIRHRTRDAGFDRTMLMQLIVSLAEVAGLSVGHLLVGPVSSVIQFAPSMELLGQHHVE